MPSILKIRVIKARNLIKEGGGSGEEEYADSKQLKVPISYYSTLKLIENTELLNDLSGSPQSTSIQTDTLVTSNSHSSLNSSSDSESESFLGDEFSEASYFNRRHLKLVERATSPSNFTFRTKNVSCTDGAPKWDEDFRLEVSDDAQLQDTPLQLHLYKDASNWIGSLTIDLNPLLARDSPYKIHGWFPLLSDELDNSSAEIFIQAKIQFFGDSNPFKESSAGVQFFCTSEIPSCIKVSYLQMSSAYYQYICFVF